MRKLANKFFIIIFFAGCLPLATPSLCAGETAEIGVKNIIPRLQNDTLKVSAEFVNLFSEKIIGTIRSGLPSIVQIELKLIDPRGRQIARKFISRSIEYDIWGEKYYLIRNGRKKTFQNFAEAEKACTQLQDEKLFFRKNGPDDKAYTVQIRVGIIPISSGQAEKVSDWIMDPNQTEETVASDNRTTGFELNINKLISFFVGKKKGSKYVSGWVASKPFRWKDLIR